MSWSEHEIQEKGIREAARAIIRHIIPDTQEEPNQHILGFARAAVQGYVRHMRSVKHRDRNPHGPITSAEMAFLLDIESGNIKQASRPQDRARQDCRRRGLAAFNRKGRKWELTNAGRQALVEYRTGKRGEGLQPVAGDQASTLSAAISLISRAQITGQQLPEAWHQDAEAFLLEVNKRFHT